MSCPSSSSSSSSLASFRRLVCRYELRAVACEIFISAMASYEEMRYASAIHSFRLVYKLAHGTDKANDAYFNLSSILHMIGFPELAVKLLEPVLISSLISEQQKEQGEEEDATVHQFLWALAQSEASTRTVAIDLYRKLDARGDLRASHKLATLLNEGESALRGNPEYARKIFDQLSNVFEHRLTEQLQYKVPWQLEEEVSKILETNVDALTSSKGAWRILDLGSGSGLCGKTFESYVTRYDNNTTDNGKNDENDLVALKNCIDIHDSMKVSIFIALDVSGKMTQLCKESGYYSHSFRCSIQDGLEVLVRSVLDCNVHTDMIEERLFDMVLAADTFIYVGALGKTFQHVGTILKERGLFAFSIELKENRGEFSHSNDMKGGYSGGYDDDETLARRGCQLQSSSRYGHTCQYIQQLSIKFQYQILVAREIVIRNEFDGCIKGFIYVLRKLTGA